ncbi:hypothetical protein BABINDRAFT_168390 [Babjeviella inositovora NRRL Y-12698]|uniref:Uncharacterized protein n=1 Tax=Babjeviella inositovora NRRL Y-12698 TaxID=984486 RepID=A0A1E3QKH0_9ASCO|nr:uncharacterized protein BABINDRAFT_168390 [Babjeviella inositovora NRRL Y-12698]ODQ78199.1 hypothetical protein BABINDRAFT_168390 [Babjeviella inositovora NRRL Y-12698]
MNVGHSQKVHKPAQQQPTARSLSPSPSFSQLGSVLLSQQINVNDSWVLFGSANSGEIIIPAVFQERGELEAKKTGEQFEYEEDDDILSSSYCISTKYPESLLHGNLDESDTNEEVAVGEDNDDDDELIDTFEEVALQLSFPNHNGRGSFSTPTKCGASEAEPEATPVATSACAQKRTKEDLQTRIQKWQDTDLVFDDGTYSLISETPKESEAPPLLKGISLRRPSLLDQRRPSRDDNVASWNVNDELEQHVVTRPSPSRGEKLAGEGTSHPTRSKRVYGEEVLRIYSPKDIAKIKRVAQEFSTSLNRGGAGTGPGISHRRHHHPSRHGLHNMSQHAQPANTPRITYSSLLQQQMQKHSAITHQGYLNEFYSPCIRSSGAGFGSSSWNRCGVDSRTSFLWEGGRREGEFEMDSFSSSISTTTASTDQYY